MTTMNLFFNDYLIFYIPFNFCSKILLLLYEFVLYVIKRIIYFILKQSSFTWIYDNIIIYYSNLKIKFVGFRFFELI